MAILQGFALLAMVIGRVLLGQCLVTKSQRIPRYFAFEMPQTTIKIKLHVYGPSLAMITSYQRLSASEEKRTGEGGPEERVMMEVMQLLIYL